MNERFTRLIAASNPEGDEDQLHARKVRAEAAAEHFRHEFSPSQRAMLLSAASHSDRLFLALASGEWEAAIRALRGYVVTQVPADKQPEYRELLVRLNVQTPLGLEGAIVSQAVTEMAAAA